MYDTEFVKRFSGSEDRLGHRGRAAHQLARVSSSARTSVGSRSVRTTLNA